MDKDRKILGVSKTVFSLGIVSLLTDVSSEMLRAYAVDLAPAHLRGTAVGAYFTFTGIALLPASVIAGFLWKAFGPGATFHYGAATSLLAAALLATVVKSGPAEARETT